MRLVLTSFVFLASIAAVVLVHAPKAHAGWSAPQQIDSGHSPKVRLSPDGRRPYLAYAKGHVSDPSQLLLSEGNEPTRRVKVPRAGRVVAFDIDAAGSLVALRETRRRLFALEGRRWRAVSAVTSRDAELAVDATGAAVAAWLQKEQSHWVVHAALKAAGARRFGPPRRLSGLTTRGGQTLTVAVDEVGEAVVTWTEAGDLIMARTIRGSFTTGVRVHDRTSTVAGAFAAASTIQSDKVIVAFTRLEDREPPQYRLSAATQIGDAAPVVETVASGVSAGEVAARIKSPLSAVLGVPAGPPYFVGRYHSGQSWYEFGSLSVKTAPTSVAAHDDAVSWREGARGYAWFEGEKLSMGRAENIDVAVHPIVIVSRGEIDPRNGVAVWDRGPGRSMRLATFTP